MIYFAIAQLLTLSYFSANQKNVESRVQLRGAWWWLSLVLLANAFFTFIFSANAGDAETTIIASYWLSGSSAFFLWRSVLALRDAILPDMLRNAAE